MNYIYGPIWLDLKGGLMSWNLIFAGVVLIILLGLLAVLIKS